MAQHDTLSREHGKALAGLVPAEALAAARTARDAPERAVAGTDPVIDDLARRRVLLDLPKRW